MAQLPPLTATPSMADRVYATLKGAITSLNLRAGDAIIEAGVARQLGVSTTPVREALQRLAREDFVELNRFRGASVRQMTAADVRDIFQLREALEPLAVRLAVPALTDADLAELERDIERGAAAIAAGSWGDLSDLNRSLHGIFIHRCGNARLRRALENLQDHNRIIALLTWEGRGYDQQEHEEHRAIVAAARARDVDAAAERMRAHIARFSRTMADIWSGQSIGAASPDSDDGSHVALSGSGSVDGRFR